MSYISLFLISFTIALSGALMPGPLLTTVIYESTRHGFKTGPLIILGHAILEVCMVFFIVFGFVNFVNNDFALKIFSGLGAVILVYFGLSMLLSFPRISIDFKNTEKRNSNLIVTGIVMSIANPYWTIWWLTIGFGLLLGARKAGFVAIIIFFIGHILADFVWYSVVSFFIGKGRQFISLKIYKGIIFICAVILIFFGVYFGAGVFK